MHFELPKTIKEFRIKLKMNYKNKTVKIRKEK